MSIPGEKYFRHVLKACKYTWQGLKFAWKDEVAFRIEVLGIIPFICITPWVTSDLSERVDLITALLLILVVELLNTSIEAAVDRISLSQHPLSGKAKDVGSAAVGLTILMAALTWFSILCH
jgi:diacylglycerol kinase (ATP)